MSSVINNPIPHDTGLPHFLAPLRFVHASDLRLNQTLEGVTQGPQHWEDRMLDVSLRAAERLFQQTIEEEVDFLILSGNVLDTALSPPGTLLFLLEQFDRLKKNGIHVYWAGGEQDSPEDWVTGFPLPENVHLFPSNSVQDFYIHRNDPLGNIAVAKLVGMSRNQQRKRIRSSEFPYDPTEIFTIAVANGDVEPETLSERRIDYWAMGGNTKRSLFHGNPQKKPVGNPRQKADTAEMKRDKKDLPPLPYFVHYPGAPLARTPQDIGNYGATLVEIPLNEDGTPADEPVLTYFNTSPVRWVNDQVTLEVTDDGGKLADELRERLKNYRESQKNEDLFINWFVNVPPGQLAAQLRRGGLTSDLLSELRSMYGQSEPLTWSVSLSVMVPEKLPKPQYEQQTMLGDYLRSIEHFQSNPSEMLHLEKYIPNSYDKDVAKTLLLANFAKDEIADAKDTLPRERWVQTPQQSAIQQSVLSEAALAGLEVLNAHTNVSPQPLLPGD
ncbi:DNA repair exonuclease [Planctomycetales bacterium]|nr:DNA repair exonuclease [Planctomycetales bacterium]